MGPASIAAEIFRPQPTDTLAAQSKRAAADDNRFEDYLDKAQSAGESRESEDVDKKDDAPKADAPDKRDEPSDDNSDAAAAQAASQAAVAQAVVQDAPKAPEDAAKQTTTTPVDATQVKPVQGEGKKPQNGDDAPAAQTQTSQTQVKTVDQHVERSDTSAEGDTDAHAKDVQQSVNTESKVDAALKAAAAVQNDEVRATEDVADASQTKLAKPNDSQRGSADRPGDESASQKKVSGVEVALKQADDERQPVIPRETVQQRKVRESTDAQREAPANAAANQPQKKKADKYDSGPTGGQADRSSRVLAKGDGEASGAKRTGAFAMRLEALSATSRVSTTTTETASIKAGAGDSAAVSAARFLISNPTTTTTANQASVQPATANNTSAGGTFASGTQSAGAASNNIVNDLLTGNVDKSGGIDGMARVLNASGVPGRYQATLRLDPPSMGTVRVQLNLQQEGLSIQVDTQSRHVSKLIESRLDDLREALSLHGIRVDKADVVTKSPHGSETSNPNSHDHSHNQYEQQSATGDADHQMPHDAQGQNASSFGNAHWQGTGDGIDAPAINETQQDTTLSSTGPRSGAGGFAPGAVDLVA